MHRPAGEATSLQECRCKLRRSSVLVQKNQPITGTERIVHHNPAVLMPEEPLHKDETEM